MRDDQQGALEAIERILGREPDADEVLRQSVAALTERIGAYDWAGISLVEGNALATGPASGDTGAAASRLHVPVIYEGQAVGELAVASRESDVLGPEDEAFLGRIAELLSLHCLVAWDTGGVPWDELA